MQMYEEEVKEILNGWDDEGYTIEDPGDILRLIASFSDETFPEYADSTTTVELGDVTSRCRVEVEFSEDGHITSIEVYECTELEWEDIRRSRWGNVYPSFDLIEDEIREQISRQKNNNKS